MNLKQIILNRLTEKVANKNYVGDQIYVAKSKPGEADTLRVLYNCQLADGSTYYTETTIRIGEL